MINKYEIVKNENIFDKIDYIICSNLSPILDRLKEYNYKQIIIINLSNYRDYENAFENRGSFSSYNVDFTNVDIDYGIIRGFISKIEFSISDQIIIDATNLILPIYSYIYEYLRNSIGCKNIWFAYSEKRAYQNPNEYKFHLNPIQKVQLDCFDISDSKKDELLIYTIGFEGVLTDIIQRESNSTKKIIINGFPSYLISYKDVSLIKNSHLFSDDFLIDYCDASNPFQLYNKLTSIYAKYEGEYRISIALCGSTPSSIGAIMFASDNNNINVIIPRPKEYNLTKKEYQNIWYYKCIY